MRVFIDAQDLWHLLIALYPLFVQALPRTDKRSDTDLRIFNAVKNIRQKIRAIPLQIQHVQLHQDLETANFDKLCSALHSLFSIFENLVADNVRQNIRDDGETVIPHHQWKNQLSSLYPKLWILRCLLCNSRADATDTQAAGNEGDIWLHSGEYSTDVLLQYARFINFHGPRTLLHYKGLSEQIEHVHLEVQEVFKESLSAADGNIDNADLLGNDEIHFIRRAHDIKLSSSSLFRFLSESIVCSRPHEARVHLSGFLGPSLSLDLFVACCENESWVCTKCEWASRPRSFDTFKHDNFVSPKVKTQASKTLHLAFDSSGIWHDKAKESMDQLGAPESQSTLEELVIHNSSTQVNMIGMNDFEPEDEKIVELLLASSLFHLNASHWLRSGLAIDQVMIYGTPETHDLLKRWRPYIACSLQNASEAEEAENEAILSFGLLVMEMEAKRRIKPIAEDEDWETGLPSKDSMLKRALASWKRRLDSNYQQIGEACLNFRELVERFSHPSLKEDMKRTAAIYSTSLLFKGFPQPAKFSQLPPASLSQSRPLIWFDDSTPEPSFHDATKASFARKFMRNIKSFAGMIHGLSDDCAEPRETWRRNKIRIASIDTGIDKDDDIIIQTALECDSIKECCSFTGNGEDVQDSHGHGTHIARLVLDIAPAAELYVAKVSDGQTLYPSSLSRIAEAIRWAHKMRVDIISLSFGFESDHRNVEIDKAISSAISDNIIIFAAAANDGGNKPRAYPARRAGVICIHASDGNGNDGGISPSPQARKSNFSTLGISIESKWKGKKVLQSGTSFATPVAAALAADLLEFARYKCSLNEYEYRRLHSYDGIEALLHLMVEERHRYDYITPGRVWTGSNSNSCEMDLAKKIERIARE